MTIEQIRELVTQAKLERALEAAAQLPGVKNDSDNSTTVTMFLSRYNKNEKEKMLGISDDDDYAKERARLTHGLLNLLSSVGEESASASVAGPAASTSTTTPKPVKEAPADDGITKILFLASNPSDTAKLQLRTEHSSVSARLQEALEPEKFPLKFKQAVTPSEFAQYLFLEKPDIVHFSGHGDRKAPDIQKMVQQSRAGREEADPSSAGGKTEEESGIFLLDEDKRNSHFVNTSFLKRTFKSMVKRQNIPIKVVVFNACHSSAQAEAISQIVPFVVGTSWSVGDKAAIAFASGFYFGIAQGMKVEDAVDFGIGQALAFNEPEDRFLLYKDGVKVEW